MSDLEAIETYLAEPRNAIVIGFRQNGLTQSTPNWFLWQDGKFFISTTKTRAKYRIFKRDPRIQLVIDESMGFRYLTIDGTVEIGDDIDAGLPYFQALRAKHGKGGASLDELQAEMVRDQRVLLMITPVGGPTEWVSQGF